MKKILNSSNRAVRRRVVVTWYGSDEEWPGGAPRRKDDTVPPRPVEKTNLSAAERALLADPRYVTEDEADFIICERRKRRGGRMIPLEQLLKRYGRQPRGHVEG